MGALANEFSLDSDAVHQVLMRARERASAAAVGAAIARAAAGEPLDVDDMALLWSAPAEDGPRLYAAACAARARRPAHLETFSPLYLTNTCDAECRMCGMRSDNSALARETVDLATVDSQLALLRRRGMYGVALLTGEYRAGKRGWALDYVNRALRRTQVHGFRHVLINVGSIEADEFAALLAGIPRRADGAVAPKLTMCTFQETYARTSYRKFMGDKADNPRADYDRRLANFDRAHAAGMRVANPGILVGLDPDLGFELIALALHVRHLLARGMEVYVSTPRLRQIAGSANQRGA
ncbi:MAG: hypothetical protein AB7V27_16070, partial [Candidatus Binatia bacterium]